MYLRESLKAYFNTFISKMCTTKSVLAYGCLFDSSLDTLNYLSSKLVFFMILLGQPINRLTWRWFVNHITLNKTYENCNKNIWKKEVSLVTLVVSRVENLIGSIMYIHQSLYYINPRSNQSAHTIFFFERQSAHTMIPLISKGPPPMYIT